MHKLNQFASGHCFPELLQKEDGKVVAQISGSIWKHNFERINKRFIEVVKEPLKEDTTLLMQVKVSFHEVYGISLQIFDIDPNYSLGELHKERAETIRKLKEEGLLNANQKLEFPLLPKRIAVISADSSKGLSDFNKVLDQNEWGYSFFRMLFPAYLQGDLAADSIISALHKIERVKHHFDVVVIVRGGGGEVGLSCYNNYNLCRAISTFPLPILTGIGHSTNMTVAELIAFRNSITPTELGEFLIQSFHNFSVPLKEALKTLKVYSGHLLKEEKYGLSKISAEFQHVSRRRVKAEQHLLQTMGSGIRSGVKYAFLELRKSLDNQRSKVIHEGKRTLQREEATLKNYKAQLLSSSKYNLTISATELQKLEQSVRLMDPVNVLKRGYSITILNGKTVSKKNAAKDGDQILTRTANFTIESTVNSIKKEDE